MSYFLSPALAQLRDQINDRWPRRDKASDGWIGDTSHAARPSDHNPDWGDGGIVRAIDVDKDGIDVDALLDAVLADKRTRYVIWNRRIWDLESRRWQRYTGSNPHDKHVHISVRSVSNHDRQTHRWALSGTSRPATPTKTQEVPDMDTTQAKQLSDIHAALIGDDRFRKLADGRYPTIDATAATGPDAPKATFRTATKQIRLAVLGGIDDAVAAGVRKALASTPGVDEAALTKGVVAEVRKAVTALTDSVEGTEYVLTPKES